MHGSLLLRCQPYLKRNESTPRNIPYQRMCTQQVSDIAMWSKWSIYY